MATHHSTKGGHRRAKRAPAKKAKALSQISPPKAIVTKKSIPGMVPVDVTITRASSPDSTSAEAVITISEPKLLKNPTLRSVHGTLTFKVADGRELQNIIDLVRALEEMGDDAFFHHVSEEKNDFSSWLRDVFELEGLAYGIRSASRPEMREKLYKHLLDEMMK